LKNITVSSHHLASLDQFFSNNPDAVELVDTLKVSTWDEEKRKSPSSEDLDEILSRATYGVYENLSSEEKRDCQELHSQRKVEGLLSQMRNLKTLVIFFNRFNFNLVSRVGGRDVHLAFLTNSLQRIQISGPASRSKETFLSAKKAVWILCFAPLLQQAILKISCSTADAAFLKEYSNSFGGLSNVKGLAISILFTWDDSIEVHGGDRDGN